MSQWTHICGAIRVDAIEHKNWDARIAKCFGNTCNFDSPEKEWKDCNVPCGSEGSVQYNCIYTGYQDKSGGSISCGVVVIHSDLRNYEDHEEIYQWIKSSIGKMEEHRLLIRDISVKIGVEFKKKYLITIVGDKDIVKREIPDKQPKGRKKRIS